MPRGVRAYRRAFILLLLLECVLLYLILTLMMASMDQTAKFGAMAIFLVIAVFEGFLFMRGELTILLHETPVLAGIRVRQFLSRARRTFLFILILMLVISPLFILVPLSTPSEYEEKVTFPVRGQMSFWVMGVPGFRQEVSVSMESSSEFDLYVIPSGAPDEVVIPRGVPFHDTITPSRWEDLFGVTVEDVMEAWRISMRAGSGVDLYVVPETVFEVFIYGNSDPAGLREDPGFLENCTYYWTGVDRVKAHLTLARGDYRVFAFTPSGETALDVVVYRWAGDRPLIFATGSDMEVERTLFPGQYSVVLINLGSDEGDVRLTASVFYLKPVGEILFLISMISFIGYAFLFIYAQAVSDGLIVHVSKSPAREDVETIDRQVRESLRKIRKKEFLMYLREEALKLKEMGNDLFRRDRYEDALRLFDRALSIDPENVSLWNNKALALRALNRYEEAIVAYDNARTLDPDNEKFKAGRDACIAALGREEERAPERRPMERARQARPETAVPSKVGRPVGRSTIDTGGPEKGVVVTGRRPPEGRELRAPSTATKAPATPSPAAPGGPQPLEPSVVPPSTDVLSNRTVDGSETTGAEPGSEMPSPEPSTASAAGVGSPAPSVEGKVGRATADVTPGKASAGPSERTSKTLPEPPSVDHLKRAASRKLLAGNYMETIDLYERALKIDDSDVSVWNNLGFAYRQIHDFDNAERCYREALRRDPNDQKAFKGLQAIRRA